MGGQHPVKVTSLDAGDKSEAMDDAKSLLLNDSDGTYQSMNVETFWNISPLFQEYPLEYFEKYYSKVKDSVVASKKIIVKEEAFLRHDRTLIPQQSTSKGGNPRWDQHAARKLLKKDVEANRNDGIAPRNFINTRPEYQDFVDSFSDCREGAKNFRKHIYQEKYGQQSSAYWQDKMKKKNEEAIKLRNALKRA